MTKSDKNLFSFGNSVLLENIEIAFMRFPLPILLAFVFTIVNWVDQLGIDSVFPKSRDVDSWIKFTLVCGFFWGIAVVLFSESRRFGALFKTGVTLGGLAVIAGVLSHPEIFYPNPIMLTGTLILLTGMAAHTARNVKLAAFWHFNHRLWLGAVISGASSVLFCGGIAFILWSLDKLFGVNVSSKYLIIWIAGFNFLAPVIWTSIIPRNFAEEVIEGKQRDFISRSISLIAGYILVPLLLTYTIILYAYAIKIGFDGSLPKGRIGWMVAVYGSIGALTVFMAWPTRKVGGILVRLFWQHWFWIAIIPIGLLGIAVYMRIAEYGVTTSRYVLVMVALWFLILGVLFSLKRTDRDIRFIPAILVAMLFIGSFGPWGSFGVSVSSQFNALTSLLNKAGLFQTGKMVVDKDRILKLPTDERRRIKSAINFLSKHHGIGKLEPWFRDENINPFKSKTSDKAIARTIIDRLGLKLISENKQQYVTFTKSYSTIISIDKYKYILGCDYLTNRINTKLSIPIINNDFFSVYYNKDFILSINNKLGKVIKFDISRLLIDLQNKEHPWRVEVNKTPPVLYGRSGDFRAALAILQLNGSVISNKAKHITLKACILAGGTGEPEK